MKSALFCSIPAAICAAIGVAAWMQPNQPVLIESFKVVLTFTFLGVIGLFVKAAVDARLDAEKESGRRYQEWEHTRREIISEFVDIFSQFYSLRKLYHSARSSANDLYRKPSPEYDRFLRRCLGRATDLEGRYGALKTLIIRHLGLPTGDYGYKKMSELLKRQAEAGTEAERLRCSLDILGEAYDDWRHAFELDRKIQSTESWEAYEQILEFLDKQSWTYGKRTDTTRSGRAE